jgi:hypothetical protein
MTQVAEKKMAQWTPEEKKKIPSQYGCEILFERTTLQQIKNPSLPSDAYIVIYRVNDETFMDLCRGSRVKIFDMYYDKFGPESVQKIDWGYGRLNPKLWGYKVSEGKKKK